MVLTMNNTRNMLKQPVMWTVSKHKNSIRLAEFISTETTPAFRNQSSLSCSSDCLEYQLSHCIRVINDDRAKADINRWRASGQEFGEIGIRLIIRREGEEVEA